MSDLISRQAALDIVFDFAETPHRMYQQIRELPTIEPPMTSGYVETVADLPPVEYAPVVRCKDCKRHNAKAGKLYRCDLLNVWYDGDFFCANGERSEG